MVSRNVRDWLFQSSAFCLYTGLPLPVRRQKCNLEHVVPRRFLRPLRQAQIDPDNLFVTTVSMNSFRRDFRFASHQEILDSDTDPQLVSTLSGALRHEKRRLFFPPHGHRTIAHVILTMCDRYPDLPFHSIVSEELLLDWSRRRLSPQEQALHTPRQWRMR